MSDKYEEMAKKYLPSRIVKGTPEFVISLIKLFSDAFCWYDEQRDKETCEWKRRVDGTGSTHWYGWETGCGYHSVNPPISFCPFTGCGRRIVEKKEE